MIFKLSIMGLVLSSFSFIVFQNHSLSLLISLEAAMLSLLMFTFSIFSTNYLSSFWFLVIVVLAACEAALGLSLLVSMLRVRGNDYTSSYSNMFLGAPWWE